MLHVHNLSQNGLNQQNIHPLVYWFLVLFFTLFFKNFTFFKELKIIITIIKIFTITPPIYFFYIAFPSWSYPVLSSFVRSHTMLYYNSVFSSYSSPSLFISPPFFSNFLHSHELASHLISAPIVFHYKSCGVIFQVIDNCYNRV